MHNTDKLFVSDEILHNCIELYCVVQPWLLKLVGSLEHVSLVWTEEGDLIILYIDNSRRNWKFTSFTAQQYRNNENTWAWPSRSPERRPWAPWWRASPVIDPLSPPETWYISIIYDSSDYDVHLHFILVSWRNCMQYNYNKIEIFEWFSSCNFSVFFTFVSQLHKLTCTMFMYEYTTKILLYVFFFRRTIQKTMPLWWKLSMQNIHICYM